VELLGGGIHFSVLKILNKRKLFELCWLDNREFRVEVVLLARECVFSVINSLVNSQEIFLISATIHSSKEVINSINLKNPIARRSCFQNWLL
jgi:hypothetical protein